jgi:hypothetical protein
MVSSSSNVLAVCRSARYPHPFPRRTSSSPIAVLVHSHDQMSVESVIWNRMRANPEGENPSGCDTHNIQNHLVRFQFTRNGFPVTLKWDEEREDESVDKIDENERGKTTLVRLYTGERLQRTETPNPFTRKGFCECAHQDSNLEPAD